MVSENNIITIYDAITKETVVREMTADELALNDAIVQGEIQRLENQAAALEARKAPLRRLGLTDDEINTVLGL